MLSVYKASAGSGKTFTLTREYIKLLLGEKNPSTGRYYLSREKARHRHTLAITFTNKATEEMKRRIVHQLAVLGGVEPGWTTPSPYEKDLLEEFRCTPDSLKAAARDALRSLLLGFNRFHVSTIDSFFQMVLRAFAREAELTGNYEVELDNQKILNDAVAQLLLSLRSDTDREANRRLSAWLSQFMISCINDGKGYSLFNPNSNLFSQLVMFISKITDETFNQHREEMLAYLSDHERIVRFQQKVSARYEQFHTEARDAAITAVQYINEYEIKGVNSRIESKLKVWAKPQIPDLKITKGIQDAALNPNSVFKAKCNPNDPALNRLIQTAARKILDACTYMGLYKKMRTNVFKLGLLLRTLEVMNQMLVDDNHLMLSDTNYLLSRIIGEGDAPFVYERVGVELRHFMIDEFQDTSRMQWQNLRVLLEEGLAYGHDSLIIGDEKQCIYRFRNSDPSLLQNQLRVELPDQYYERGTGPENNINWRSTSEVVRFNNRIYSEATSRLGYADVYANVVQGIPASHADFHGYVSVTAFASETDSEGPLLNMISHIKRQLASGYRPSDIAVLVRGASDGKKVSEYLSRAHLIDPECPPLRVVSDDAVTVDMSDSVRLIVSILRMMATCDSGKADRNVSTRLLARLLRTFEGLLSQGHGRSTAMNMLIADFDNIMAEASDASIAEEEIQGEEPEGEEEENHPCANLTSMVEQIIATVVGSDARRSEGAFLSAFQDMVLDFSRRGEADIVTFVRWWDLRGRNTKVSLPADPNAIRMMTIHKSKGLEFGCVHIPLGNWELFKASDPVWFNIKGLPGLNDDDVPPLFPIEPSKDMLDIPELADDYAEIRRSAILDELNVGYVAMTRAVNELIIGLPVKIRKSESEALRMHNGVFASLGLQVGVPYEEGEPTTAPEKEAQRVSALEAHATVEMPEYKASAHPGLWENTRLEEEDEISVQRKRGLQLHNMLSMITDLADVERAAARSKATGVLSREEAARMAAELVRMISQHGVRRWFEGARRVLCEREMVDEKGFSMRPDRVVWLPDGVVEVIDYKTGEEYDARYRKQVRRYMRHLKKLGCRTVRGYIWYLDTDKIVEC